MKNSKEYSKKVQKLYRSLKRKYPAVQKITYDEPVDALVYAIISAELSETAAQSAIKRLKDYFVDLNDLRISRTEEIIEVLGPEVPTARDISLALITTLRAVFSKYNMVSLKALYKMSKRPAKGFLEKMDGANRFMVDYCMLTSLHGHAIPLTKKMIEFTRSNELVHSEANDEEIESFLARQISAENAYEFYSLLRRESETRQTKGKKKPIVKKRKK